ncbi:MAG: hypothetical protein PHF25_07160 [Candidatus Margulisbacteria bacterium]|nr:hypothetical protein [Candidatus Margulisiibacteriota bacterium]
MLVFSLYAILLLIILGAVVYFGKPTKKQKKVDTADIQISVENKQVRKTRAIEENEVVREAESHFKTLVLKNPYSPLPYKVLAEFYIKNGLKDEAIKKCEQMIPYLNKSFDLEKATTVLEFLETNQRQDLIEKITSLTQPKEN